MSSIVISLIVLFTVWALLPLVPAVLIYLLFPDTSVAVSGPLANLTVRAGGAFAAYLIVLLVTFQLEQNGTKFIRDLERPLWTITGTIKFLDKDKKDASNESLLKKVVLRIEPDPFMHQTYDIKLRIAEDNPGEFPSLVLVVDDVWKGAIDLNPDNVKMDDSNRIIKIKSPILVQELPHAGAYAEISSLEKISGYGPADTEGRSRSISLRPSEVISEVDPKSD
ncbi:MAG: hypothetical protein ACREC0_10870 [Methylocella sp.]